MAEPDCSLWAIIGQAAGDIAALAIGVALVIGLVGWILWILSRGADEDARRKIVPWVVFLVAGVFLVFLAVQTVRIWLSTC